MVESLLLLGLLTGGTGLKELTINPSESIEKNNAVEKLEIINNDNIKGGMSFNSTNNYELYSNNNDKHPYQSFYEREYSDDYLFDNTFENALELPFYFKDKSDFQDLEGYKVTVFGSLFKHGWLFKKYDVDYYKFILFGDANVNIFMGERCFGHFEFELYAFNGSRQNSYQPVSVGNVITTVDDYNGSVYKTLNVDLPLGIYLIKVYGPKDDMPEYPDQDYKIKENNYSFDLNVDYCNKENFVSIGEERYTKGLRALAWISDFDPFGFQSFSNFYGTKKFESYNYSYSKTDKDYGNPLVDVRWFYPIENPIEDYLMNYGKIKHSSLYLWGKDTRTELGNTINKHLKDSKAALEKYKEIRASYRIVDNVATSAKIILSFVPVIGSVITAFETASEIMEMGGLELPTISECLLPNNVILTAEAYSNYLTNLAIALGSGSNRDEDEVIKIDSYYKISKGGIDNQTNLVDYFVDFYSEVTPETVYYTSDLISNIQEDGFFKGHVYGIKKKSDVETIKNHQEVRHSIINTGGDTEVIKQKEGKWHAGYYLNEGQYRWYSFTAGESGNYEFYSEINDPDDASSNLDPYGEIFTYIATGRSTNGVIQEDNDSGYDKNFSMKRHLNRGDKIYIRVRGNMWKTHGNVSLEVERLDVDPPLETGSIKAADFKFPCEYCSTYQTKDVTLSNGTKTVVQRYRCGYVRSEEGKYYLTLSSKKKGFNWASLFFKFEKRVRTFEFSMAFWGPKEDFGSNLFDDITVGGNIWDSDFGGLEPLRYLNTSSMSKNRDNPFHYIINFPDDELPYVVGICIETQTYSTSDRNKGRIILDDISFSFVE